jgi:hypothetical protein
MTSLKEELKKREVDYDRFTGSDEHFRKRVLKGDYDDVKGQYKWEYDQPITKDISGQKVVAPKIVKATKKRVSSKKKRSSW